MNIDISYRPSTYSAREKEDFREFRKKVGADYRFCQNNRQFYTKNRAMRKVIVGITVNDASVGDIFLLFNVEYAWHSKPQTDGGCIEIVRTELMEINDGEPSKDEKIKFRDSFKDSEEFKRNLIKADYYKYG